MTRQRFDVGSQFGFRSLSQASVEGPPRAKVEGLTDKAARPEQELGWYLAQLVRHDFGR